MEIAVVNAIAELARQEQSDVVAQAYGIEDLSFGAEYIIPKPFDPRLIVQIATAVAWAAMTAGVASRPLAEIGRAHVWPPVHNSHLVCRLLHEKINRTNAQ